MKWELNAYLKSRKLIWFRRCTLVHESSATRKIANFRIITLPTSTHSSQKGKLGNWARAIRLIHFVQPHYLQCL